MRQKPFQLRRVEGNLYGKTVLQSQRVFPGCRWRYERVVGVSKPWRSLDYTITGAPMFTGPAGVALVSRGVLPLESVP